MPGMITVSARSRISRPWSGSDLEAARRSHRSAVGGAGAYLVEPPPALVAGGAEDLGRVCRGRTPRPRRGRARRRGGGGTDWAWPDSFTWWLSGHSPMPADARRGCDRDCDRVEPSLRPTAPAKDPPRLAASPGSRSWRIIGAAGFRATPGVLITPLQEEFGWSPRHDLGRRSRSTCVLFGLTAPFAAALMDRFGMRRVVAVALLLVAAGQRADRVHDRELAADAAAGACWSGSAPGRWRWSSSPPSPAAGSSSTAAWSPACSPPAGATGQLIFLPVLAAPGRRRTAGGPPR